jgi:hypothetical protein
MRGNPSFENEKEDRLPERIRKIFLGRKER